MTTTRLTVGLLQICFKISRTLKQGFGVKKASLKSEANRQ
jgi:hypothetical protein